MAFFKRAATIADDEGQFDRLGLARLGLWACATIVALTTVVFAGRSEIGSQRLMAAVAAVTASPADPPSAMVEQVLARTADVERESRRLAEALRSLTGERDRLALRLGLVEREMGDLTGSITRGLSGMAKAAETMPPAAATPQVAVATVPAPAATEPGASAAGRQPAKIATVTPASEPPAAAPAPPPPAAQPEPPAATALPSPVPLPTPRPSEPAAQAMAAATYAPAPPPGAIRQAAAAPAAPQEPASVAEPAPPYVAATASMPAASAAAASGAEAKPQTDEPQPKVEIGLDLGPALTLAKLRQRWAAFQTAHRALADTMRPIVTLREIAPNKPAEMRLVVGPVADVHVAAQLCAALHGSQFMCVPAVFDGQRLALK